MIYENITIDDLTLDNFIEIVTYDNESSIDKMIYILSILDDIDIEELYERDIDENIIRYTKHKFIHNIDVYFSEKYVINDVYICDIKFELIDLNTITYGQLIDVDSYLTKEDNISYIPEIVSILYLQNITERRDLDEDKYEDYSKVNIDKRSELFRQLPCVYFTGIINYFSKFRTNMFNSFNIFNDEDDTKDEDYLDDEYLNDREKREVKQELEKQKKDSLLFYDNILYYISDGDVSKFEYFLSKPAYYIFYLFELKSLKNQHT